jgi:hypothetical protein
MAAVSLADFTHPRFGCRLKVGRMPQQVDRCAVVNRNDFLSRDGLKVGISHTMESVMKNHADYFYLVKGKVGLAGF